MIAKLTRLAAFCCLGIALLLSVTSSAENASPPYPDYRNALWIAESHGLIKLTTADGAVLFEIKDAKEIRALAVDAERGVLWAYGRGILRAYGFSGQLVRTVPLPQTDDADTNATDNDDNEEGDTHHSALVIQPQDGSVWLGIGKSLHHFSAQGQRLTQWTLKDKIQALALDGTTARLWVATKKTLAAYDAQGTLVSTLALSKDTDIQDLDFDIHMDFDIHIDALWVALKNSVRLYSTSGVVLLEKSIKHLRHIASDGQGGLWVATEKHLLRLDQSGLLQAHVEPFAGKGKIIALAADPSDRSAWVASQKQVAHVNIEGQVQHSLTLKDRIRALALYADVIPPSLDITSPVDGSYLNSKTPLLHFSFSDIGIGVNPVSLVITDNGLPLGVICTAHTDTSACTPTLSLSEGVHTLNAIVKDYAGNTSAPATVSFTVDTIPPEITLTSPADGLQTTEAEINITGQLSEYATTTLNGAAVTLDVNNHFNHGPVTLHEGENAYTLNATDRAGNIGTLTFKVIYIPVKVTILSPASGATLNSDHTLVIGTYKGPLNTGITVNGVVAETDGDNFYADNVPLNAGANTLTATATTPSGASATDSVTVTGSGQPPQVQISADPQSGIAPLQVSFTVTNNTTNTITKIDVDFDGNGTLDITKTNPDTPIEHTYTTPGVYQASVSVTDNLGQTYTSNHVIVARSVASMDILLRGVYGDLLDDLRSGNIEAALQSVSGGANEKYRRVFSALKSDLATVVNNLGTLQDGAISNEMAEYVIVRNTPDGPQAFLIYFIRSEDGIWRIDGM